MLSFNIQKQTFSADLQLNTYSGFAVQSVPRPYYIDFMLNDNPGSSLLREILAHKTPLLLIDSKIADLYFMDLPQLNQIPTLRILADEDHKKIESVMQIVDFFERNSATKTSMLFVVGGGILQDLGAFAGYIYKRGLPWTFTPTTLLAQGDSCVGGKTAINYKNTKNLLALFSAPRRVVIDTGFLKTLPKNELLSGVGEIFRLCITGGPGFLEIFAAELPAFLDNDLIATTHLIAASLSVKRAIVEFDEFELDIRRSMNYGHSFGHALESLSQYHIPHGVGVTIGILVENQIAHQRGMLSTEERDLIFDLGRQIIPSEAREIFAITSLDGLLSLLLHDKKTEGTVLKLAALERIGQMRFIDLMLDAIGEQEFRDAVNVVLASLNELV